MEDVKSILTSKTIGGLALSAIGLLGNKYGYTVTPDNLTDFVNILSNAAQSAGLLVALYGRIKATKKIG